MTNKDVEYGQTTLSPGIRSRFVNNENGLDVHFLEAGNPEDPCILFLHGFPELAYSWRHILLPIAERGYHAVAPDQRGYGRTTGWDADYNGDLASYRMMNLVDDTLGLAAALGHETIHTLVGHDFGSPVAAWSTLSRPDVFRSVILMSSPFAGLPSPPVDVPDPRSRNIHDDLADLTPPRKHYQWYYSTPEANSDMQFCPQGVHEFLRAYYHHKSTDWERNTPYPLAAWTAEEIAQLPYYYVMEKSRNMAETVADEMPTQAQIAECGWLTDEALAVYAAEFQRTGFQGGLKWYRCATGSQFSPELQAYADRHIDVPAAYIAGKQDWGTYQKPGSFEQMQSGACSNFRSAELIENAGHWVQQEQPEQVIKHIGAFIKDLPGARQ